MEFKLNKIDTDIRNRMQEERKDDKVHSGKAINVKRDVKEERNKNENKNDHEQNKEAKYVTVDCIKYDKETVAIKVEKLENIDQENSKGRVLDAKK